MTLRIVLAALLAAVLVLVLRFVVLPERESPSRANAIEEEERAADLAAPELPLTETRRDPLSDQGPERALPEETRMKGPDAVLRVRVRGQVRFSSDGRGAAGVELAFHSEAGSTKTTTRADGNFETDLSVSVGLVRVSPSFGRAEPPHPHAAFLRLERSGFIVPESAAIAGEYALELLVLEPDAFLTVQLVRDGAPAPGRVRWSSRGKAGHGTVKADHSGLVELAFAQLLPGDRVRLEASSEWARSAGLALEFPWEAEVVRLELLPAGVVEVHVSDADGRPLEGRRVHAGDEHAYTDVDGRAELEVRAGPTLVGMREDGAAPDRTVDVPPGSSVEVELLSASRLVAAGTVLSEKDQPLPDMQVLAAAPGLDASAITGEDGRFEIRAPVPAGLDWLYVVAGGSVEADCFEPEESRVRPGATDLRFRQVAALDELELSIAMLDSASDATIPLPVVLLYRAAAPHLCDSWGSPDGMLTCSLRAHEDLVLVARAQGYRERVLTWSELAPTVRARTVLTLPMEPGLELAFAVWSRATHTPLAGALVLADGVPLATSGPDGRVRLAGPTWPAAVRVEAPGHAPLELDARELLFDAVLQLDPP